MTAPAFHITISGSMLALYGAVLSTITAAVQILNHLRDRVKVVLKVRKNMKSIGMGPRYDGMMMVIVTAANAGRRPVTINGFAANLLYNKNEKETDWYLRDVHPSLPYEITEGKEVTAFVNQEDIDFDSIAYWCAWDSTGRHFRLNVAPRYKQWLTHWRRRNAQKAAAKAQGA